MRHPSPTLVVSLALMLSSTVSADRTDDAVAALQGTWRIISITENGLQVPQETVRRSPLVIIAGRTMRNEGSGGGSSITISAESTPHHFDIVHPTRPRLGIFALDGDRFTLCHANNGGGRPDGFDAGAGTWRTLLVFERVRSTTAPATRPAG